MKTDFTAYNDYSNLRDNLNLLAYLVEQDLGANNILSYKLKDCASYCDQIVTDSKKNMLKNSRYISEKVR